MTTKPILVAVDGGSGNIAIRFDMDGKTVSRISPALVRAGNLQHGAVESGTTWETIGEHGQPQTYSVVTSGNNLVNTCDPGYQASAAHRVLVINALAAAGLGGKDVIIADTLPADQYYGDNGQINQANIKAKKQSLMTEVKNYSGTVESPRVLDVKVYPEAVPAYYSAAILPDMTPNPEFEQITSAIVVDVGRFTCDIAEINRDYQVVSRATTEHGIQIMLQRLHTLIQENEQSLGLKETKEISVEAMDAIIRQGYIGSRLESQAKKRKDVTHLIQQAAREMAEIIRADIRGVHRNLADIDLMLVVGGGANWIGGKLPHINDYTADWDCPVIIPDNPELAIVRGVHLSMLAEE
ncbi:TPA: plasmid segregation protein ParM domain-containing protein [Enterobacter cloacae]